MIAHLCRFEKKIFQFCNVFILCGSERYVGKSMKISTEIRFVHVKYIFYTLFRINLNILRKSITKEKKNKTNLTSLSSKLREIQRFQKNIFLRLCVLAVCLHLQKCLPPACKQISRGTERVNKPEIQLSVDSRETSDGFTTYIKQF